MPHSKNCSAKYETRSKHSLFLFFFNYCYYFSVNSENILKAPCSNFYMKLKFLQLRFIKKQIQIVRFYFLILEGKVSF